MAGRRYKQEENKHKKKRGLFARIMKGLLIFVLILCLAGGIATAVIVGGIVSEAEDIDPTNIYETMERNSYLYDKNGELIETLYYDENRKVVSYEELPVNLVNAFVAIEDKTFWTHRGFNFKRMIGAVWGKLTGKASSISGTSTITQQLARNVYLPEVKSQRTLARKITEMYYARQIERALPKEDILEAYLNTVYLGYGCYGVESAAETYFNKSVSDLSLAECAALAALPQAPDTYALLADEGSEEDYIESVGLYANDASKDRRNLTLELMREQKMITADDVASATVEIKDILDPHFVSRDSKYTYFIDFVADQAAEDLAKKLNISKEAASKKVYTGGLHIYSTIDPEVQDVILGEFDNDNNFPDASEGEEVQSAMVITEVETGKVIGMVGGRGNPKGAKLFNRATSPRQPGSSIKPLSVYSAALQKSYECEQNGQAFPFVDYGYDKQGTKYWGRYITAGSYVSDEKMYVNGNAWPNNDSRTFSGANTVRSALQKSINTCAVKIQLQVGADYSLSMLDKYGISTVQTDTSQPVNDVNPAALSLGAMTYGVTPLDMSLAYAAFPSGGIRRSPVCFTKIVDSDGSVLLEKEPDKTEVMDEGVAWIMTDLLKSCVSQGIAGNASLPGVQSGGKTGTTNDAYDIWFCGFTPTYSAALWIGTDKNKEMYTRSSTAAALWSRIMSQVPGYADRDYRDPPENVVTYGGEYYTSGTEGGAASASRSGSTSSNDTVTSDSEGASREDFVRDFTGGNHSSGGSGGSYSGSGSREFWVRNWRDD